ncbi:MAG TPA: hypothetical protein VL551_14655 [Actinospica sp.]|nr:hypothetical protein [Actinospica sp.]
MSEKPFTDAIRHLHEHDHMNLSQLARASEDARSGAWFSTLIRGDTVNPPPPKCLPGMAQLLKRREADVAAMIAEEWYGVAPPPNSAHMLTAKVERLSEKDVRLVNSLVARLVASAL